MSDIEMDYSSDSEISECEITPQISDEEDYYIEQEQDDYYYTMPSKGIDEDGVIHDTVDGLLVYYHPEGGEVWYDANGEYHSHNDNPAIRTNDLDFYYYNHGKLHRKNNMPAVGLTDGTMQWWTDGKKTRETRV